MNANKQRLEALKEGRDRLVGLEIERGRQIAAEEHPEVSALTDEATTAFWDAYWQRMSDADMLCVRRWLVADAGIDTTGMSRHAIAEQALALIEADLGEDLRTERARR